MGDGLCAISDLEVETVSLRLSSLGLASVTPSK